MFDFITNPGGGQIILIPHLIVFLIGYRRWLRRQIEWRFWPVILDVLGFISSLIALIFTIFMLFDVFRPTLGSYGTWYVIYAAMTIGMLIPLTHIIFYLSGRFVGRVSQLWRLRKLGQNLGRQSRVAS